MWTTSPGPVSRWCWPLHSMLEMVKMYTDYVFLSYKDMFPLHEWKSLSARRSAIGTITHNRPPISMTKTYTW